LAARTSGSYHNHHDPLSAVTIFLALATTDNAVTEEVRGKVFAVTDGDTLSLLDATSQQHKIRFAGIDAPESRQPFGQRAKKATQSPGLREARGRDLA